MKTSFLASGSSPAAAGGNLIVTSPKPQLTQVVVTDEGTFNEPRTMTVLPGTSAPLITEMQRKLKLWRERRMVNLRKFVPAKVGS